MGSVLVYVKSFFDTYFKIPDIRISDIVEIIIIALLVYQLMVWIKNTKAWMLFKGIAVVVMFVVIASFFELTTILWIAQQTLSVAIIAIIIIFQPEIRRALEQLGRKQFFSGVFSMEGMKDVNEKFSDKTIDEIIKATFELAKTKTGALMVIEKATVLTEYEKTGIPIDAVVTNQLLINIFEKNTPLHDGAVLIRGDKIVAATCYLPLSDNMEVSKELGTRHRAALGMSEESDSLTIIVSEETGKVSLACDGRLARNVSGEEVRKKLQVLQNKVVDTKKIKLWKGRGNNERKISK